LENPRDSLGVIDSEFEKFKQLLEKTTGITPRDKEAFQKVVKSWEATKENLNQEPDQDLNTEIPQVIGLPEHAGAGDVEPCL
jgi:hypothetical protein